LKRNLNADSHDLPGTDCFSRLVIDETGSGFSDLSEGFETLSNTHGITFSDIL
jgi:hypothetical protein